jgi:hypothetical protein
MLTRRRTTRKIRRVARMLAALDGPASKRSHTRRLRAVLGRS